MRRGTQVERSGLPAFASGVSMACSMNLPTCREDPVSRNKRCPCSQASAATLSCPYSSLNRAFPPGFRSARRAPRRRDRCRPLTGSPHIHADRRTGASIPPPRRRSIRPNQNRRSSGGRSCRWIHLEWSERCGRPDSMRSSLLRSKAIKDTSVNNDRGVDQSGTDGFEGTNRCRIDSL